jgi:signal transduction histidine kinase
MSEKNNSIGAANFEARAAHPGANGVAYHTTEAYESASEEIKATQRAAASMNEELETSRKELQAINAALKADNNQLRARISQLEADAEKANRAIDDFVSVVSHELRTPLNTIRLWARMLGSEKLAAKERAEGVQMIERAALAQQRVIDDLRDASRITSGKLK